MAMSMATSIDMKANLRTAARTAMRITLAERVRFPTEIIPAERWW